MAECGYFSVELEQVQLSFKEKPAAVAAGGDLSLRADIEILNALDVFKFVSNGEAKLSTGPLKAFQKPEEDESSAEDGQTGASVFILGFADLFVRSNYIDLNAEVISALANATVSVKIISINEGAAGGGSAAAAAAAAAAPPAKGAKATAPIPTATASSSAAVEEVVAEVFLPLSSLLTSRAGSIHAKSFLMGG